MIECGYKMLLFDIANTLKEKDRKEKKRKTELISSLSVIVVRVYGLFVFYQDDKFGKTLNVARQLVCLVLYCEKNI